MNERMIDWLIDLIRWSNKRMIMPCFIVLLIVRLLLIHWLKGQMIEDWLIVRLFYSIDCKIILFVDWVNERMIDWEIDWEIV